MKFEIKTKIGDYEFVKEFKNEKILKETLEEYESLKLMIPKILNIIEQNKYKNKIDFCLLCEGFVMKCNACGNNCCNGGYGEIGGKECENCPKAYDEQTEFWNEIKMS